MNWTLFIFIFRTKQGIVFNQDLEIGKNFFLAMAYTYMKIHCQTIIDPWRGQREVLQFSMYIFTKFTIARYNTYFYRK